MSNPRDDAAPDAFSLEMQRIDKEGIAWTYMQAENDDYVIFKPDGDVCGPNSLCDYLNRLERENAELLEALRHIERSTTRNGEVPQMHHHVNSLAREAIAKAEGR